ncbi:PRC-barrel domain-containing protein [Azospirillum thermophilum]|uniref:Uncharacterized protein n=1 Tax=Azospirillum thermophilum TaxID=2202148 RepID=A0A2S2CWQ0_9PROT|nr:PRC-barrel domain-containing protein [Azospirillum thermophilum]AWK88906.1 hypothetical protein DEW08_22920 [Azospirillum thermophilum]
MRRCVPLRPALLAACAAALLAAPAPAETTVAQQTAPLMTAPRPEDQPATDATTSPTGVDGEAPSREVQNPAPPAGSGSGAPVATLPPDAMTADQARALVGRMVRTRDGLASGEIQDFTLSPDGDRVERVVLSRRGGATGGEAGGEAGGKLVSVPVTALRTDRASATLDLDSADLTEAPAFTYGDSDRTLKRPQ